MEKYNFGACVWFGESNEEPMFGCTGKKKCFKDGQQMDNGKAVFNT